MHGRVKFATVVGVLCALFLAVAPAHSQVVVTQGEIALALAQVLGFDVTTIDLALTRLKLTPTFTIQPESGWQNEKEVTGAIFCQLEASLKRAVDLGLMSEESIRGAVVAAAASKGLSFDCVQSPPLRRGAPPKAPINGTSGQGSPFVP